MPSVKRAPHVLVVDDCVITCDLLTALLSKDGYQVTAATDGAGGLVAARNHKPDLAIVDLHLPDISGIELAELLQPEIPFLALTIDRTAEAVRSCIEKGALGYLVKPLDSESFLRQVRIAIKRGREQRNLNRALNINSVVDKAIGFLMGFLRISEREAFESLAAHASERNSKVVTLAKEILDASELINRARAAKLSGQGAGDLMASRQEAHAYLNRFRRRQR